MTATPKTLSFRYVFVPSDVNEPLEERTMQFSKDEEIEVLTRTLQEFYKAKSAKPGNHPPSFLPSSFNADTSDPYFPHWWSPL